MLRRLVISNVALIDKAEMEFSRGLNILTGETGAGKTVIIDSINAITGRRSEREIIRTGSEKASVEAVFEVQDSCSAGSGVSDGGMISGILMEIAGIEPEPDGTVIISREFTISGKNTCRINGRLVTLSVLRQFGECLLDMHGQHDNQSLLRTSTHAALLDSYGRAALLAVKSEYEALYRKYRMEMEKLAVLKNSSMERARREDLYRYQTEEIRKAGLKKGEEEELKEKRIIIANSEKIIGGLSEAYDRLAGGGNRNSMPPGKPALEQISVALAALASAGQYDGRIMDVSGKLQDIYYELEEIASLVREMRDNTVFEPESLEAVEDRLDLIYSLKRKYGSTIEEIKSYYEKTAAELRELQDDSSTIAGLESEIANTAPALYDAARRLNALRREAAKGLKDRIMAELEDLEMRKALFETSIKFSGVSKDGAGCNTEDGSDTPGADSDYAGAGSDTNGDTRDMTCDKAEGEPVYSENGLDAIEFMISPNPGEPLKPLARIASGGEMSRIMLAMKTVLADADSIPTLVFDEIDAGISGRVALKVAEKLALVSAKHQVICVTHLAQIACMADRHFLIRKSVEGETTKTTVEMLDWKGVEAEISTILSGDSLSETTQAHARELLANARSYKRKIGTVIAGGP